MKIPAIRAMSGKPFSELVTQSICDLVLSCPTCKKTTEINATKQLIDNYKTGAIKIKCGCGWEAKFYFEYHAATTEKDVDCYCISDVPIPETWWVEEELTTKGV